MPEVGRWTPTSELWTPALDALRARADRRASRCSLHQDLHGENVLAAQREPWLVIDPKPLVGEREFAVAPIVRSPELGHSKRDVLYRLDRLCAELDLDRERARGWTIAQTIAWSGGSATYVEHATLETARMAALRAVLFDVDFTLARPGPELMPEGYVHLRQRVTASSSISRATTRRVELRSST